MIIRDAVSTDIPKLQLLDQQSESAAHWTSGSYAAVFRPDARRRLVRIIEEDGRILGFIIASCLAWEWEIENIVVSASAQRRTLGSRLAIDLFEQARRAGVERVCLEVRASNHGARAFYLKLGFQESGRRRDYYSEPAEDAILFHFDVTGAPGESRNPLRIEAIEGLKPH